MNDKCVKSWYFDGFFGVSNVHRPNHVHSDYFYRSHSLATSIEFKLSVSFLGKITTHRNGFFLDGLVLKTPCVHNFGFNNLWRMLLKVEMMILILNKYKHVHQH